MRSKFFKDSDLPKEKRYKARSDMAEGMRFGFFFSQGE